VTAAPRPYAVLIRAIGGATHRKMPLADLCRDMDAAGFGDVRNYLSTGNVLLRSAKAPAVVARKVEELIARYGLALPVFVRRPVEIRRALAADPFPDASRDRPARMLVTFFNEPVPDEAVRILEDRDGPERIVAGGRELYIDFAEGVGVSWLTPNVIERAVGRPGTARNWNTLRGILERL
jgi:uncharacterized protein (DUF1697 family)